MIKLGTLGRIGIAHFLILHCSRALTSTLLLSLILYINQCVTRVYHYLECGRSSCQYKTQRFSIVSLHRVICGLLSRDSEILFFDGFAPWFIWWMRGPSKRATPHSASAPTAFISPRFWRRRRRRRKFTWGVLPCNWRTFRHFVRRRSLRLPFARAWICATKLQK